MGEEGDSKDNIEMKQKGKGTTAIPISLDTVSNPVSAASDKPPNPPRRDYSVENAPLNNEDNYASVEKRSKLGSFPRPEVIYKAQGTESWMSCIRNVLVVFNLFIWLLGAVITAVGIWIKVDRQFLEIQTNLDLKQFANASVIFIVVGIIIMLIGFVGCYGAAAEKMWLLIIFAVIVVIIILLEIAVMAVVWTATTNKNVKEDIKLKATKALSNFYTDDHKRYFIDLLQHKLKCCGVNGPNDYSFNKDNPIKIPESCTNIDTGRPYEEGCFDAVMSYMKGKASIVGGIAVSVLVLQIAALVLTVCLICTLKQAATNSIF